MSHKMTCSCINPCGENCDGDHEMTDDEKLLEKAANAHAKLYGNIPSAKSADAYNAFLAGAAYHAERIRDYEEALAWYANRDNYNGEGAPCNDKPDESNGRWPNDLDRGVIARDVLEKWKTK